MDALTVGAEIGGIIAGAAVLVPLGLWITRKVRTLIDTRRSECEQAQAAIAALQSQVTSLQSQVTSLQRAMNAAKQAMTEHVDVFNEFIAAMRDAGNLNTQAITGLTDILKGVASDTNSHTRDISELRQHVKDLSNGIMPHVGGTHPTE